jgi:hypothetical protein
MNCNCFRHWLTQFPIPPLLTLAAKQDQLSQRLLLGARERGRSKRYRRVMHVRSGSRMRAQERASKKKERETCSGVLSAKGCHRPVSFCAAHWRSNGRWKQRRPKCLREMSNRIDTQDQCVCKKAVWRTDYACFATRCGPNHKWRISPGNFIFLLPRSLPVRFSWSPCAIQLPVRSKLPLGCRGGPAINSRVFPTKHDLRDL